MLEIQRAGFTIEGLSRVLIPDSRTTTEREGSAFASRVATTRPVVPPKVFTVNQYSKVEMFAIIVPLRGP